MRQWRFWTPVAAMAALGWIFSASGAWGQPIEIRGWVTDAQGAPLAGARVELVAERDRFQRGLDALRGVEEAEPRQVVGSDRQGRFELAAPGPGLWKVRVLASGYVPMTRPLHPLLEEIDLGAAALSPDEGVWVFVSDAAGEPVPGARVEAWPPEDGDFWSAGWQRNRWWPARRTALANDEGWAWLSRAAGETVDLRAYAPGLVESARVRSEGDPVRLVLAAGAVRRLRVVDHQSRPVAGAVVRLGEGKWVVGASDESGRLEIVSDPASPTPVRLDLADRWSLERSLPPPASGDEGGETDREGGRSEAGAEVTLRLPLPLSVEGRMLDAESREPVPGALVWLAGNAREAVVTDRLGRFRMPAAPVAEPQIQLDAAAAGYLPRRWGWEPKVDDGQDLPLELFPSLTLAGTVVDAGGAAVAEAEVRARRVTGPFVRSWQGRGIRAERTGPNGGFRLSNLLAADHYEVQASAAGLAPSTVQVSREESTRPLVLVLLRGARLRGTVVNEEGQPVAGARVRLFEARETPRPGFFQGGREADFSVSTDETGGFVIGDLPRGRFDLSADASGYAGAVLPGVEAPEAGGEQDLGTLVLAPGAQIEGWVVDPRGAPLEGARVMARAAPTSAFQSGLAGGPPGGFPEAVTDIEGRFAIRDLHPGEAVSLEIERQGYLQGSIRQVTAPTEEPLTVTLRPGARIFGVVVDSGGSGVAGAQILAEISTEQRGPDGRVYRSGGRGAFAQSEEEGRFSLDGLEAGEAIVRASTGGLALSQPVRLTLEEAQEVGPVRLVVEPGVALEGRVLDPTGAPASGAVVHLIRGEGAASSSQAERTGADGRFRFQGARPGPAQVRAEDAQGASAEESVEIGAAGAWVELVLESGLSISGRVVDEDGEPVPFAMVQLAIVQDDGNVGMRGSRGSPGGTFVFPKLEPGRYRLTASAPGWAETTLEDLPEVRDRPLTGIVIQLSSGGAIVGRISGVEPETLGRVTVVAYPDGERTGSGQQVGGLVSFDGTYRIPGVTAGEWRVVAAAPDGRIGRGQVIVSPGQAEAVLDLDLRPGLTLEVAVRLNGEPVPGLTIQLWRAAGDEGRRLGEGFRMGFTDPGGRVRFSGLEAGSWRLTGSDSAGGLQVQRQLDLNASGEVVFDLSSARVRGRLVTVEGLPVDGGQVVLSPLGADAQGGAQPLRATSGPEGRWELPVVLLGRWRLQVFTAGGTQLTLEIDVGGSEMDLGDLAVGPVRGG